MDLPQLKRTLQDLIEGQKDNLRLRDHLEGLRREFTLAGLTWYWGPLLYRRSPVIFRTFIQRHFGSGYWDGRNFQRVHWKDHAAALEAWLKEARERRERWLVGRLIQWKYRAKDGWNVEEEPLRKEVLREYDEARSPAARAIVLQDFDLLYTLDEASALRLYQISPLSRDYILRHVPRNVSYFSQGDKRELWTRLFQRALESADDELAFGLYRRQAPLKKWAADVIELAGDIEDVDILNAELKKRHPEGWGLELSYGILGLLDRRGRDIMPYLREMLQSILSAYRDSISGKLIEYARKKEWWDLWAVVTRSSNDGKQFNQQLGYVLHHAGLTDTQRIQRMEALGGVSREWNWPGFGLAVVHELEDDLAEEIYRKYPQVIHGALKPNVMPRWHRCFPKLLHAAESANDEDLVDQLTSRYITRSIVFNNWTGNPSKELLAIVEKLAEKLEAMRTRDSVQFATRAANILTQIPAFSIWSYNELLKTNPLARLLFVRSFEYFLSVPNAVRDLVEGSEIHVQMLGYRILSLDDPRARQQASDLLPIMQGTLLRPLHRKTRLAAFGALKNAAKDNMESARLVLQRARMALRLPDKKYPKEELIGLIAQVLAAHPELRSKREQPVVFEWQGGAV